MSLIPTIFRSTDPGAPILTGTAGSFAALMDAVLINGYGVGAESKAPLGWIRAFSDGHKRAYQNSIAEGGTGMLWRVDDSNAQYVMNSGYHAMSGIDAGIDGFSLTRNAWPKSVTANSIPRAWFVVGNSRTIYIFVANGNGSGASAGKGWDGNWVGDFGCLSESFAFNFGMSYSGVTSVTNAAGRSSVLSAQPVAGASFIGARSLSGASVGQTIITKSSVVVGMTRLGASAIGVYPYPVTGGTLCSRVLLNIDGNWAGWAPGLWTPEHSYILAPWTVYEGEGYPTGRSFAISSYDGAFDCQGLLQLDVPWGY